MSVQPRPSISFDDWLAGERASLDERHEYLDGEIFAMSGGTAEHNIIISNINRELSLQMKGRPCQVFASGMKLRILSADAGKYPDLMALCGELRFHDGRRDLLLNPSLIGEVLSESTEADDRGGKFKLYRGIPSLREYLLVSQDQIQVELYSRDERGRWVLSSYEQRADSVSLASIGCSLALAEVYDKVLLTTA